MNWADLNRSSFTYTAQFCEENIWCLCRDLVKREIPRQNLSVLFLSSPSRKTPILQQKSSTTPDQPVWWDYHVILLMKTETDTLVFDFDSCLTFPVSATEYFRKSFYPQADLLPEHQLYTRKVGAKEYLEQFFSNRTHMLDLQGKPLVPFPDYPPINQDRQNTISLFEYLKTEDMQLVGQMWV